MSLLKPWRWGGGKRRDLCARALEEAEAGDELFIAAKSYLEADWAVTEAAVLHPWPVLCAARVRKETAWIDYVAAVEQLRLRDGGTISREHLAKWPWEASHD